MMTSFTPTAASRSEFTTWLTWITATISEIVSVARMIHYKCKSDHITPLLKARHQLPISLKGKTKSSHCLTKVPMIRPHQPPPLSWAHSALF